MPEPGTCFRSSWTDCVSRPRQLDTICDRAEHVDDVLLGIVLGRLAESPLSDQAADLLLASLDGDESLSAQLTGQAQPRSPAPAVATSARPAGAYLRSLTVSGFRGIGPSATLTV